MSSPSLIDAAKAVLPYLKHSLDEIETRPWYKGARTDGQRLRMEADWSDKRDAAITAFRDAIEALEPSPTDDTKPD